MLTGIFIADALIELLLVVAAILYILKILEDRKDAEEEKE